MINPDFSVDLTNKTMARDIGEQTGDKCYEKFGLKEPCPSCPMQRVLGGGDPETVMVAGANERHYSVYLLPLNATEAGVIEVVRVGDLSPVPEEAEVLKEQTRSYTDKIGTLTTSFFGMAHNLKNPLTALQGKIQIFGMKHPEFKSETEVLLKQCDAMTSMLGEVNQKFKLEQNTDVRPIDVNDLIENELRFLCLDLNIKHSIDKVFLPEEGLPPVSAVYSDLSLVINNIMQNAFEAMSASERKILTVTTKSEDDSVVVVISDTGHGIPKEHIPKIFMPFYRVDSQNESPGNTNTDGRGLGLFIAYEIVRKYGGEIDVESMPNVGTKLILRFPAQQTG
jgi:signal transduction histidine kinase